MTTELSFEAALAASQTLVTAMAEQTLTADQIQDQVAQLVQSETGARGFFVTYLTGPDWVEPPPAFILQALAQSPEIVSELLVKNLAMATAMALTHRRNQDETNAQGSDQVQRRTQALLLALALPPMQEKLQQLAQSIEQPTGAYQDFLARWGYDSEQKQVILQALTPVLASFSR
ncbi:hypothetical protein [Synechocystis sp. LKSZ1]|uniref:hypothetical protein n=1 Tax=Synechocystis sp. LKSZ1 TaxID=3144951 RepID=UPI00336BAFF3